MRTAERRYFEITDGLIVVAAIALGNAATRWIVSDLNPEDLWITLTTPSSNGWSFSLIYAKFAEFGWVFVIPSIAAWTLACMLMRLRSPRPIWRRLVRQPGAMASFMASAVIGLTLAVGFATWTFVESISLDFMKLIFGTISFGSLLVGMAVLWSWTTMGICGRWGPEPTWLDRLGRLLGTLWIAIAILYGGLTGDRWIH